MPMGGREKRRETREANDWIRDVSDDRLRGYARMLASEGRYRRGDSVRPASTQHFLSTLVTDEILRRGGDGEMFKGVAHREFDEGVQKAWRPFQKKEGGE